MQVRGLATSAQRDEGLPWGAAALPRHLRRRATSHNSYRHRRRPNVQKQQACSAYGSHQATMGLSALAGDASRASLLPLIHTS